MAVPQQFSLRWNNYSQHIVTALEDLRSDDEFTDVTLSCDGERLKAHKILLAACSTYFRDTFLENPCKHPVIILKGVTFTDLEAVVKFMYNGQVNVSQDRLPSFLQTAELLQIKGLTDMNDKEDNSKKRSHAGNGSSNSQNQPSNLDSNSTRSATPDVPNRPPTPKRKRIIGGYQNDGAGSSGNASFSSSSTMPNQPIVIGSSSNGASASTSSGGLLNPQSVVIPSASSTSSNVPTQPDEDGGFHNHIVKFEDDDIQDDEFDEKHMSSEDNDNSAQDMLCNVEPGSIGVFSGSGPSGMNASGAESTSHGSDTWMKGNGQGQAGLRNLFLNSSVPSYGFTQKNRPRLYYNGFAYNFNSAHGNSEYWRCAVRACKGWIVNRGGAYMVTREHTRCQIIPP